MARNIENIRNIGIIAHIDAGKTTVTERMLYLSGAKHNPGDVDKGTTETDDDPEEEERGITIYAACVTFPWKGSRINLLDTPGHVDFTAEVERCLRVLDGAVVVFSAREGVEAQSETVWRQADKYEVPRVVFINKLDREGADFESVYEEIGKRLGANPIAVSIPVGQGPAHVDNPFRGIIDLIRMRMLSFTEESKGKEVVESEIPETEMERAEFWRDAMLDKLYGLSDAMMHLALEEQPIPVELIQKVLRQATLDRVVQPLLCGSALRYIAVQTVLDAVQLYLPNPLDRPPVKGTDPKKPETTLSRKPDDDEPFCGLVFKIIPAKTGDTYWVRVYSGKLKANSRALNPRLDKRENVAQLWMIHATRREPKGQVPEVGAGDIVGVIGPRDSVTGDTLCEVKEPILLPSIQFAETVVSMAIEPESTAERKKLAEVLEMLKRQDPTFKAQENEETGQTLISGMGELHLEVIKHRLLRDFNLDVRVHKPRVSYRETVEKAAEVTGECHRHHAGAQLFARLTIRMEPFDRGEKPVIVINRCPPEKAPIDLISATLDELRSRGEGGGMIGGFPLTKLRITILDAETQLEGSNEMAFTIAAGDAFMKGLNAAGPVLLEPIMKLEISTPEEYFGSIDGDLQQRRGYIIHHEQRGDRMVIEARAPLSELFGYSNAIRSLSQGRASASMEPLEYAPAPAETAASFGF